MITNDIDFGVRPGALAVGLDTLEAIIERGKSSFEEVGRALLEIRNGKLYKEKYGTWENYCEKRWGWTGRRGRQLMAAAKIGTIVPNVENEHQARQILIAGQEWTPTLTETAIVERVNKLYSKLASVKAALEEQAVEESNLVREIGLHVQGLAGPSVKAKKIEGLKAELPKALTLKTCRLCVRVAKSLKEKAESHQDAMRVSKQVLKVCNGVSQNRRRQPHLANALSPCTVIANALGSAMYAVEKQFRGHEQWDAEQRELVLESLKRHVGEVEKAMAKCYSPIDAIVGAHKGEL